MNTPSRARYHSHRSSRQSASSSEAQRFSSLSSSPPRLSPLLASFSSVDAESDLLPPSNPLPLSRQPHFLLRSPSPTLSSPAAITRSLSPRPHSPTSPSALQRLREEIDRFHRLKPSMSSVGDAEGWDTGQWDRGSQWRHEMKEMDSSRTEIMAMAGQSRGRSSWSDERKESPRTYLA